MTLIPRTNWMARPPAGPGNTINAHPLGVAIHHSETEVGSRKLHGECITRVRNIQTFHMSSRGYADIAYNFLVCQHGDVFEGRGIGRGSAANGTTAANANWYAVCAVIGGKDVPTLQLLAGIGDAIALCRASGAGQRVVGHRDLFATACPGAALYAQVKVGRWTTTTKPPVVTPPAPVAPPGIPTAVLPTVNRWQGLLAFAPARRDGIWGTLTDRRSQWLATAARTKAGTLAGSADSTIRLIQRVIGTKDDGAWGPASRLAMTAWIKRAQVFLEVPTSGNWDYPTRAAYARFRNANHHS